jgi:hypothetical protein
MTLLEERRRGKHNLLLHADCEPVLRAPPTYACEHARR